MKILICSKLFYPNNAIGAVRPSNFARYLSAFGHEISVITEETNNNIENPGFENIKIIRISNSNNIKKLIALTNRIVSAKNIKREKNVRLKIKNTQPHYVKKPLIFQIKEFYKTSRAQIYNLFIEIDWFIRARKVARNKYGRNSFDIVISSFGPIGSFYLGYFIIRSRIAGHWISDLRDNMQTVFYPFWLNGINKVAERIMVQRADAITLVSHGQVSMFCQSLNTVAFDRNKIFVINNGFENAFSPIQYECKDNILRLSYTGQLYTNFRNLKILFHAVNDLIETGLIDTSRILFYYAGPDGTDFNNQAGVYQNILKICKNFGLVDKSSALDIQKSSDILVALTWNSKTDQGMLTGKIFEYMQANKPIISLTTGNLINGELTQMVEKLKLGIACEYIAFEKDYSRLRGYILTQYNQKQEGKSLVFNPDFEAIQRFQYENITKELNKICLNIELNN
jgi:hypothetical protein